MLSRRIDCSTGELLVVGERWRGRYGKSNTTVLGEDGVTREVVKLDEDDNVKKELDEEADDNREEW